MLMAHESAVGSLPCGCGIVSRAGATQYAPPERGDGQRDGDAGGQPYECEVRTQGHIESRYRTAEADGSADAHPGQRRRRVGSQASTDEAEQNRADNA